LYHYCRQYSIGFSGVSRLSQSCWLCESLGLISAVPRKKRRVGPAENEILGCGWSAQPTNRTPNTILLSYFVEVSDFLKAGENKQEILSNRAGIKIEEIYHP